MKEALVVGLVRWWCHQEEGSFIEPSSDGFIYDNGLETSNWEDFVLMRSGSGAIDDLEIIDLWCGDERAAVMFEGTDSITDLRHRVCWMIALDGDRLRRVLVCSGVVPKPHERPAWK